MRSTSKSHVARLGVLLLLLAQLFVALPAAAGRFLPVDGVTSFESYYLTPDGRARRVLYVRPVANPASGTLAPMIVVLHFAGGDSEEMANLIEIGQLVRSTGIWAVLPNSVGRSWSFDPVRDADGPDDVGLITQVIDYAVSQYPIDARRIYMTGFSAGGFMTQRYVCEHSERIAAAAYVSATLLNTLRDVCQPRLPTPMIGMHGTADTRVSYESRVGLASAPDTALFFANINRCLTPPASSSLANIANDGTTVRLDSYASCATAKPVRFYTVEGGGHTWPGNEYQFLLLGRTTQDIEATQVIWDFVRNYSR